MITAFVESVFGSEAMANYQPDKALVLSENNDPIAHVGVFDRIISLNGQDENVMGIGYVCTAREFQGCGVMKALIRGAHKTRGFDVDFALLWTGSPALYEPLGYRHAPNLPPLWMVCELTDRVWPRDAVVDLKGTW